MEEPKTHDQTLNVFKTINGFVKTMNECYGSNQKTLQLYARLISKTTIEDETPMTRHIAAFTKFCTENKDAILEKNHKKLNTSKISYNDKVYINMQLIFNMASASERVVIWKHILTIYAFIDPQSKAKEMLREVIDKDGKGGKEEEFLTDIFDKVGSNITPDGNPLQAVGSLMSSGIFTDIVGSMSSGLENGELDLGRLMGSMQGMVTNIGSMAGQNGAEQQPEMAEMLGQMTAMMGNLNKMSATGDAAVSEEDLTRGSALAKTMINTQLGSTSNASGNHAHPAQPAHPAQASLTEQVVLSVSEAHETPDVQQAQRWSSTEGGPKFEIIEEDQSPSCEKPKSGRKSKRKDKKRDIPAIPQSLDVD